MNIAPIINVACFVAGYLLYRLLDLAFALALAAAVFFGVVGVFDYFLPWAVSLAR